MWNSLSPTEKMIFEILFLCADNIVLYDVLAEEACVDPTYLKKFVGNIRKKLHPIRIENVRMRGYVYFPGAV